MRAGRLRHRVSVQSAVQTRTADGAVTQTWSTDRTAWAAIEPLTGREFFAEQQTQADVSHRILLRYKSGLTPRQRIVEGSRVFHIEAVINRNERNISHEVMAREVVS